MRRYLAILLIYSQCSMAMLLPFMSFSDETGTMAGAFIQHPLTDTSHLQLFLLSQKKGQSGFINATNIPVGNDRLNVKIYGSNTGQSYYGVSNLSKKINETNLYFTELSTTVSIEKPIHKKWDALLGLKFTHYNENTEKNKHAKLFNDLNDIGLMIGLQRDTRNTEFNTTQGYFNAFKALIYNHHQIISNDVRYFFSWLNGTLAMKFFSVETFTNNDHLQYLSGVGNYNYLRGYKSNDIIDRHLTYAQLEWRKPLVPWFILTPFIEAGVIGRNASNLKKSLFSYGLGGYFPIGGGSLRLEIANAEKNSEFYVGFNHVF